MVIPIISSHLQNMRKQHEMTATLASLLKWTKKVDVLTKDYLVVPINEACVVFGWQYGMWRPHQRRPAGKLCLAVALKKNFFFGCVRLLAGRQMQP